jgi:4-hydroxy-3-polyprenylbenzoate decarboxylase
MAQKRLVVAITGASGAVYAERTLQLLAQTDIEVHLTISNAAVVTFQKERGRKIDLDDFAIADLIGEDADNVVYHPTSNIGASIASGSFRTMGMMIVPCSMGTLGALAAGLSMNLVHRAADVCFKERRKLVIVPRETPLATIHLENMHKLSAAGAVILPAMPGFYHDPRTLDDQVDFVVSKLFDQFDLDFNLMKRWEG